MKPNDDRTFRRIASLTRQTSGFSLLEQCAVLPVILLFILGTIDVTNLLRASSAMQQGVKTALRCVSPTDALCVKPPDAPVGLFEVTKTSANPLYFGYRFTYSGQSSALQSPTYHWPNPSATVLDKANIPVQGFSGQASAFNALASIGYNARIATFPKIVGNDPRNPNFELPNNRNYPAPRQFNGVNLFVPGSGQPDNANSVIQIQRPALNASLPCVLITDASAPVSLNNIQVAKRCEENWDWDSEQQRDQPAHYQSLKNTNELSDSTYVVIHALGSSTSPVGTLGKVILTLEWSTINSQGKRVSHSRDLGGSLLDGTGGNNSTNLYPRGAPLSYVDSDIRGHEEFDIHQAIRMDYGVRYKLNFRLIRLSGSGSVAWNGGKVNVYMPVYKSRSDERLNCHAPLTAAQLGPNKNQGCTTTPLALTPEFIMGLSPDGPAIASAPVSGCYVSAEEAKADLGIEQVASDPSASCILRPTCPTNKGVGDINSNAAFDACPINAHGITRDNFRSFGVTFSEKMEALAPISVARNSCKEAIPDIGSAYEDYPKLSAGELKLTYADLLVTDQNGQQTDPATAKQSVDYACSDFTIWSETYNSNVASVPNTSLFKGERPDLGCSWERQLADEARVLRGGKHQEAYFSGSRTMIGGSRYQLANTPQDSCITYTTAFGNDHENTRLGTFEAGRFPAECAVDGAQCSAKFVGFSPGQNDAQSGPIIDSAQASKMGMDEIQAAFPSARSCAPGQANCANVSVEADDLDKTMAVAQANVTVPVSLLFNHPVTLTYTDRQRLEATFSK